jgi:hypothetical protein
MKQIQPIQIWINGQLKTAHWLDSTSVYDNLLTEAKFSYFLYAESLDTEINPYGELITDGSLVMNGQDYIDWNNNPDINEDAYIWIANKLGLTLI